MSWYYYLENQLKFPFEATCKIRRAISPLKVGEAVTVTGLASETDCMADIVVLIRWQKRSLGVPLSQLAAHGINAKAVEAIADWHYWLKTGDRF